MSEPPFPGIRRPNYTMFPDEYLDTLMADLTGAEFKVLAYIVRRTFGWKRDTDAIAIRQMARGITRRDGTVLDRGTGLSTSTIQAALKGLVEKGAIMAEKRSRPDGGLETTVYSLRFAEPDPYVENRHSPMAKIDTPLWRKSTQQQTAQQTDDMDLQQTETERPITLDDRLLAATNPKAVKARPPRP